MSHFTFSKTAGILFFLLQAITIFGQTSYFTPLNSIPVLNKKNEILQNAWAGGLNSSTVSTIDINLDGKNELLIFDRQQEIIKVFELENGKYIYRPLLESYLPRMQGYALCYDFNKDNKKDLFTASVLGIQLFKNTSTSTLFKLNSIKDPVLTRYYNSNELNMNISSLDLPAITDIDKDGDLDILHFDSQNGENVVLETNFGFNKFGTTDSLYFGTTDNCWGGFYENSCDNYGFGRNAKIAYNYRLEHVGAGAISIFDADGNNLPDVLIGKDECQNLVFLKNNGNVTPFNTSSISKSYPISNPSNSLIFPLSFFEDVTADQIKDLIVTTGKTENPSNSDLSNNLWLYQNLGTNTNPIFSLISKNWLQNTMIDYGQNTAPTLADKDGDGDQDLFLGYSSNQENKPATIIYFENIGTANSPIFSLADTNFLDLASQAYTQICPTFSDLNNDNQLDLIYVSKKNNTDSIFIHYNTSKKGLQFNSKTTLPIFGYSISSITFYDINNDQLKDLILGGKYGDVQLFNNTGTSTNPIFTNTNTDYGGLSTKNNHVCVHITDLDLDKKPELIVANDSGFIKICYNFLANQTSNFEYSLAQTSEKNNKAIGKNILITSANLIDTTQPNLIIGNATGGLLLYQLDRTTTQLKINEIIKNPIFEIWPNPTKGQFTIETTDQGILKIYDQLGQLLHQQYIQNERKTLNFNNLKQGVYFLLLPNESKKTYSKKLMVE